MSCMHAPLLDAARAGDGDAARVLGRRGEACATCPDRGATRGGRELPNCEPIRRLLANWIGCPRSICPAGRWPSNQ